jgi:hypothetical protein
MFAERHLGLQQLDRAVTILEDELAAHHVRPFLRRVHRLFNWSFVMLFAGYGVVAIAPMFVQGERIGDLPVERLGEQEHRIGQHCFARGDRIYD